MADQVVNVSQIRSLTMRARSVSSGPTENYVIAMLGVLLIASIFMAVSPACRHWFVLAACLCGMLVGGDVVAWIRGQLDVFDPKPLVSLLLFHITFLSPMLHQANDFFTPYYDSQVEDWGRWFGLWCLLSAVGLLAYKAAQRRFFRHTAPVRKIWVLDDRRFVNVWSWAVAISSMATMYVFVAFRGLGKESGFEEVGGALVHTSWILALGDPLALLLIMGAVRMLTNPNRRKSIATIGTLLILLVVAQFLLLGLRGSRSAVLYALFIGGGMAHYKLGRVRIGYVLVGMIVLFAFVYYYAFFKKVGSQGFEALKGQEQRASLERRTGITPLGILLGDLSRAEVQAFMLFRLVEFGDRYNLRWGVTYVRAAVTIIPRAIYPNKPEGPNVAGTDLQYGQGSFRENVLMSSRVYGVGGEAMLNFGVWGVPLMYACFGAFVGWYRGKLRSLPQLDSRFYVAPILSLACVLTSFGDADNVAFGLIKNGALPFLVIMFSSVRRPMAAAA